PPVSPKQEPEPAEAARPESQEEAVQPESRESEPAKAAAPVARPVSPWVIAPFSGAVAAALVIGVGWMLGWPQVQAPDKTPQLVTVVDGLNARVNGLEARLGKADSTSSARLDTLDKSLATVRGDVGALHAQS